MIKLGIKADELKVNLLKLAKDRFIKFAVKELSLTNDRLADASLSGKNAHGESIRASGYSPGYRAAILAGKVQARGRGGARKTNTSPVDLRISGDLLASRQVTDTSEGAEMFFSGDHYSGDTNAELAQKLHDRGFTGWHEYGLKDELRIQENFDEELFEALDEAIEIKRNT